MYDLIVCNPPYFEDSLPSPDPRRAEARHNVSLSYDELFECASALLTPKGRLSLIVPTRHFATVTAAARDRKLFLIRKTNVYPTPHSNAKRHLLEFSKTERELEENDLVIETSRHCYTPEYKELTADFYL